MQVGFQHFLQKGVHKALASDLATCHMQLEMKDTPTPENARLIGYARVSTADQRLDLQIDALKRAGVDKDDIFIDTASGARVTRRGLTMALRALHPGDTFIVWKLDRLSRSLTDLLKRMEEFDRMGVRFRSLTERIDMDSAMGKLLLHVLGAMAQFERDLTKERTAAGMRISAAKGVKFGADRKLSPERVAEVKELLLTSQLSVKQIAKRFRVSTGTIYNTFPGGRAKLLGMRN
jgi:DNA invertase Pin-like site-specific DNA recombinase